MIKGSAQSPGSTFEVNRRTVWPRLLTEVEYGKANPYLRDDLDAQCELRLTRETSPAHTVNSRGGRGNGTQTVLNSDTSHVVRNPLKDDCPDGGGLLGTGLEQQGRSACMLGRLTGRVLYCCKYWRRFVNHFLYSLARMWGALLFVPLSQPRGPFGQMANSLYAGGPLVKVTVSQVHG